MEKARDNPTMATGESQDRKQTKRKSTFVTLIDICHLMNVKSQPKLQNKYKGRVVLRGDIVKDDSGAYAVFTEQGPSAFQMTGHKSNACYCKIARL